MAVVGEGLRVRGCRRELSARCGNDPLAYLSTRCSHSTGRLQQLQQVQPLAEDLVVDRPLRRFRGGKPLGLQPGEERQVVDQLIDLIDLRADHHERGGGMGGQRGRHQRARRAPDSVQSRRMAPRQTLDDLGEALLSLQASDQFQQPVGRGGSRIGVGHDPRAL